MSDRVAAGADARATDPRDDGQTALARPMGASTLRRLVRNRTAAVAGTVVLVIGLAAILAPVIAPYEYSAQDFAQTLAPPGRGHLLGTDEQGRDILSRVIYGGRISLPIGIIAVSIAAACGLFFGLVAGYVGGWADTVIMRLMDVLLAFPTILLALAVIAILGPGIVNLMIAIGISSVPLYTRVVRGSVLTVKHTDYVAAAQAVGGSAARIVVRHLLPNSFPPVMVLATIGTAAAIITSAALSYIGLGAQPPLPEWGSMLNTGREYLRHAPWMTTFPGLAIVVTVVSINLLGDGLRDVLDPRLR